MSSNIDDGAQVDITARGFGDCKQQNAFFNVRLFNPQVLRIANGNSILLQENLSKRKEDSATKE